jgi:hypothetical protein
MAVASCAFDLVHAFVAVDVDLGPTSQPL